MNEQLATITPERMEAAGIAALHEEASEEVRQRLGLRLAHINGTTVSIAAHDPSPLLNRAVGLGLHEPANAEGIERICAAYEEHEIDHFYVGIHPEARPADVRDILGQAGLEPARGWMKFERPPDPAPMATSNLSVRKIGEDHVEDFGRIAAAAYGMIPDAGSLVRGLIGRPGSHLYMTFDGDTPAGTGLLAVDGDCAWFEWASTDPAFRQRGSQRALLARRIEDAIDAGCTRLMTCTGEAVPGDPQHSYHNIEWAGFKPTFVRENWTPAGNV